LKVNALITLGEPSKQDGITLCAGKYFLDLGRGYSWPMLFPTGVEVRLGEGTAISFVRV
jgi:hypothetical protein